jgi:uncharacterized protein YqjF (DUF2071 family)
MPERVALKILSVFSVRELTISAAGSEKYFVKFWNRAVINGLTIGHVSRPLRVWPANLRVRYSLYTSVRAGRNYWH